MRVFLVDTECREGTRREQRRVYNQRRLETLYHTLTKIASHTRTFPTCQNTSLGKRPQWRVPVYGREATYVELALSPWWSVVFPAKRLEQQ